METTRKQPLDKEREDRRGWDQGYKERPCPGKEKDYLFFRDWTKGRKTGGQYRQVNGKGVVQGGKGILSLFSLSQLRLPKKLLPISEKLPAFGPWPWHLRPLHSPSLGQCQSSLGFPPAPSDLLGTPTPCTLTLGLEPFSKYLSPGFKLVSITKCLLGDCTANLGEGLAGAQVHTWLVWPPGLFLAPVIQFNLIQREFIKHLLGARNGAGEMCPFSSLGRWYLPKNNEGYPTLKSKNESCPFF